MPHVYILNLENRTDRKAHLAEQFENKPEFEVRYVRPLNHPRANISLWLTMQAIVKHEIEEGSDYFIFCEDDHKFTQDYHYDFLAQNINNAQKLNADILSGGVSWASKQIQITDHLFWIEKFSGLQFTVIFKRFYSKISTGSFTEADCADGKISTLTDRIFMVYPVISIQREFGYSDVTPKNNIKGRVDSLFKRRNQLLEIHNKVRSYYQKLPPPAMSGISFDDIIIPTYVINLLERTDRLKHIQMQFTDKEEFDVTLVEACKHKTGAYGLWLSIRKAIQLAIDNKDDVMILCEDDHKFTKDYSRDLLIRNIIEANSQGADFMSCGSARIGYPVPISPNRFWVSYCLSSQFLVVFKRFFKRILDEKFDEKTIPDLILSRMTDSKMLLYPFISIQKNFGYSDATELHKGNPGLITKMFHETSEGLKSINEAYLKYEQTR